MVGIVTIRLCNVKAWMTIIPAREATMLMLSSKMTKVERRTWAVRWRQWRAERRALEDAFLNRNKHLLEDADISHEEARDGLSLLIALRRVFRRPDDGL
jgi:hypothetical protein